MLTASRFLGGDALSRLDSWIRTGGYEELARARLIYFSSVRDPIDRIVSQYYYARATPRPGGRRPPVPSPHRKIDRKSFSRVASARSRRFFASNLIGSRSGLILGPIPSTRRPAAAVRQLPNVGGLHRAWPTRVYLHQRRQLLFDDTLLLWPSVLLLVSPGLAASIFRSVMLCGCDFLSHSSHPIITLVPDRHRLLAFD